MKEAISIKLDGAPVSHSFDSDTNIVSANINLIGDGDHYVTVSFSNKEGLSDTEKLCLWIIQQ